MKRLLSIVIFAPLSLFAELVNFEDGVIGAAPAGWVATQTGEGKAKWSVEKEANSPGGPLVLKQSGLATYPICFKENTNLKDGFVEVQFKPVAGSEDQAGGVIWRCQDADNYYVARANALEDNVTIYHTLNGRRSAFKSINIKVAPGVWHLLRIEFHDTQFAVFFDGKRVLEATDSSLTAPGKIGVWTKADSVTLFDNFRYGK